MRTDNLQIGRRTTRSGLSLTELGVGGAQFGNLYREMPEGEVERIVDAAWEAGVRLFDTAPHYGMGLSERRLGRALAQYPRDEYVLSTKVGRLIRPNPGGTGMDEQFYAVPKSTKRVWDFSGSGVRRSIEESLERLGLDRIDIAYIHDPDDHWEEAINGAGPALQELRAQGVISSFGAGMNQSAMVARFIREGDADLVMLAGRYTLLEQGALADVFPAAEETGASVVIAGVYNSGLLARPRPKADTHYNYEPAPAELVARANRIADVCERHGLTLPEVAVAFVLLKPQVASVVVGTSKVEQFEQALQRYQTQVPADLWEELASEGLVAREALS
ncbi:aldo/keto reductase [Pseudactinotalea sp. Z1748]|uniref:aldo/keto reductase n=1 Tax=Pseudactinotalea sp. Z1748 TaxID=3413027 RepID=UPI003C799B9F